MNPIRNKIYSFEEILQLNLTDDPFLRFVCNGDIHTIQNTDSEHVRNNRAWLDSKWAYALTTREGIPLFHYRGRHSELIKMIDIEPLRDPYAKELGLWVTPKIEYVQQTYELHPSGQHLMCNGTPYILPPRLIGEDDVHPYTVAKFGLCCDCAHTFVKEYDHAC